MHISWIILPSTLPCSSFRSNVAVVWLRMSSIASDIWTSYVSHGGPICIFSAWPCWRKCHCRWVWDFKSICYFYFTLCFVLAGQNTSCLHSVIFNINPLEPSAKMNFYKLLQSWYFVIAVGKLLIWVMRSLINMQLIFVLDQRNDQVSFFYM